MNYFEDDYDEEYYERYFKLSPSGSSNSSSDDDLDEVYTQSLKSFEEEEYIQPLEVENGKKGRGFKKNVKTQSCWMLSDSDQPTLESTLKCISLYYSIEIIKYENEPQSEMNKALIRSSPIFELIAKRRTNPLPEEIYAFLSPFFAYLQLTAENAIILMVYIDRVLKRSNIHLAKDNWAILLLGALMLTCKVWHDESYWNADFCSFFF